VSTGNRGREKRDIEGESERDERWLRRCSREGKTSELGLGGPQGYLYGGLASGLDELTLSADGKTSNLAIAFVFLVSNLLTIKEIHYSQFDHTTL
jgi:hypothetical protein